MLYTGREQDPRTDPARTAGEERRFARRIDCAEAGQARQPVNPSPSARVQREPQQGARRRLDID
jgi:hypothetical protein